MPTDSRSPTLWRSRPASSLRVGLGGWLLLVTLGGCGGGAQQAGASTAPETPAEPSGIDAGAAGSSLEQQPKGLDHGGASSLSEAMDELEAAEKKIAGLFGGLGDDDAAGAGDVAPPDGQPAPAPRDQPRSEANAGVPADRCATACRALESMQRSAERLCELVGGDDGRCDDARTRVTRAERVVADACPACQAAHP